MQGLCLLREQGPCRALTEGCQARAVCRTGQGVGGSASSSLGPLSAPTVRALSLLTCSEVETQMLSPYGRHEDPVSPKAWPEAQSKKVCSTATRTAQASPTRSL